MNAAGLSHFWGPGHVVFGRDCIRDLEMLAAELEPRDVLIIVDRHVLGDAALRSAIETVQAHRRVTIAEHDGSEPSLTQAAQLAAQDRGDVSLVVAVGGGSTIDIAKAVVLARAAGGQPLARFEGATRLSFDPVPLIAVPTTAGTGSEVTGSCVLTDYASGRKVSIRSPKLRPRIAILDPHFLASVPKDVIRATGIDALTHALEAYHSTAGNVVTDRLALGAIALLGRSITSYYANPADPDASASMAIGSCMAGMAFNSARVGLAHAVASAIGPLTGFSHGLSVGLALPAAMRTNLRARAVDRKDLLFHIGCPDASESAWQHAVLDWLDGIYRALDFPRTAREAGQPFDVDDRLIRNIINSGRLDTNPVPLTESALRDVLETIRG
jgi:alcohol dehydrogenase